MLKSWEWWHMPYMPGLQSQRGRFGSSQLEEKEKKRRFSVISQQCSSVTSKFSNVTCKKKMKISWSIQDYLVSLSNLMEHFSQNILYNCVHCDEEASSWPVARAWFISESRLVSRQMRLRVWLLPITSWKYLYSSTRPQIFLFIYFQGNRSHKCNFPKRSHWKCDFFKKICILFYYLGVGWDRLSLYNNSPVCPEIHCVDQTGLKPKCPPASLKKMGYCYCLVGSEEPNQTCGYFLCSSVVLHLHTYLCLDFSHLRRL